MKSVTIKRLNLLTEIARPWVQDSQRFGNAFLSEFFVPGRVFYYE